MIEHFDPLKGERLQILDEAGRVRAGPRARPIWRGPAEDVCPYGPDSRLADGKALKLQRQGRLGTFASSRGHEACQVGVASAMQGPDWLFPYFRDLGAYITLGYPLQPTISTTGWGTKPGSGRPRG